MGYSVTFKTSVIEDMHKIGQAKGERILRDIYQKLSQDPSRGEVLKVGQVELWQHKVGDFTVVYTFLDEEIRILSVLD